jgi:hypothetical protein
VAGVDVKLMEGLTASSSLFYTDRFAADRRPAAGPHDARAVVRQHRHRPVVRHRVPAEGAASKFFGWLAYTYSRSDRIDRDGGACAGCSTSTRPTT